MMEVIEEAGATLEEAKSKLNSHLKLLKPIWASGVTVFQGPYGAWHILMVIQLEK